MSDTQTHVTLIGLTIGSAVQTVEIRRITTSSVQTPRGGIVFTCAHEKLVCSTVLSRRSSVWTLQFVKCMYT